MPTFTLTPEVVPLLCQVLMAGIAGAYILSIDRKTRSAWWLTTLLVGNGVFAVCYLLSTIAPSSPIWSLRFGIGLYVGVVVAGFAGLRLAYTFLARPFRREERIVAGVAGLGLAGLVAVTAVVQVTLATGMFEPLLYGFGAYLLATTVGALVVHLRQSERFRRLAADGGPRASARRAAATGHRSMAGLTLVIVGLALLNALTTLGVLPQTTIQYGSLLFELVIAVGLIVVFINHAPEPSSVQAKLVGIALGVVLGLMGLTSLVLLQPADVAEAAGNVIPAEVTVHFQPDAAGGYTVTRAVDAGRADDAPLGEAVDTDSGRLRLPFAFPIGGERYRDAELTRLPYLSFGPPGACSLRCLGVDDRPRPDHPLVAAFVHLGDIDRGEPPRVAAGPDRVDIRWAVTGDNGEHSAHRATLWPDGAVEIAYRGSRRHPGSGAAGLMPGGDRTQEAAFSLGAPATLPPGTGLVDPYGARYAARAGLQTRRMIGLVLGATLVVLLLIPLFLRRGVLAPIEKLTAGLEHVDQGRRGVRLSAHSNDEMGLLIRRFNTMMGSLETAERSLREYAGALESRVADRTRSLREAVDALGEQRDALSASLDELRTTQARLVQAEKQASMGRLTAGIAHELRNPLNFVTGFAEMSIGLADDLDEALRADPERTAAALGPDLLPLLDDLRSNTERVLEHGRRAERIVEAMVLHAPTTPASHRVSDLNALLRLAAEGAGRAYTSDCGAPPPLEFDLDPDVGDVDVQAEGVVQVTVSLLENALHAVRPTHGGVCLRSRRDGDAVTIQVADDGPGMDAETSSRAFEPFFTTKPPGEGTGLGLSLAYDIVTAGHGGTVELETAPGAGATFTVRLPVHAFDAGSPVAGAGHLSAHPTALPTATDIPAA